MSFIIYFLHKPKFSQKYYFSTYMSIFHLATRESQHDSFFFLFFREGDRDNTMDAAGDNKVDATGDILRQAFWQ